MNWITTNIRLPEDIYMELKMKAAKERKSVAAVMRERLAEKEEAKKIDAKKNLEDLKKFARKVSAKSPNLNLTQAVIDARYQQ